MNNELSGLSDAEMLRKKAEEQLRLKQKIFDNDYNEADVKKLVHELQVHQIELEMQNEELKLANETAETALKKYTMLYDLAPIGYFILDKDGSICDLNFTGADMLRDKRFNLINSNFKLYISEKSKPVFNDFFKLLYTGYAKESCHLMLGYDSTTFCHVYMEGVVTDDDRNCLLSVVDISEFSKLNEN
ncbi:MAG: hypothetical protein K0B15_16190 [Lentimicrobium sp.]|nr:hypothetical protein [Lentimicrobium sp.]